MDMKFFQKACGRLIEKAWEEDEFRAELVADPMGVLKREKVPIPEGKTVRVLEETDDITHLVLPLPPKGELSIEQLERVAGGSGF
ncbi:MAG: NHLP leader peptide family natural product precursor [Deltaproteobacteria bacterium]|nr:NHLP leader peptide family natural product precursor [Deltaproteobacteria bacterium]